MTNVAAIPVFLRSLVIIGFIGAYTTFSTYVLETVLLLQRHEFVAAGLNLLLHTFAGLAAVIIGMLAAGALRALVLEAFHAQ